MTVKEILKKYNKIEIELLLAHVLKKPKEFVFINQRVSLSAGQQVSLSKLIKRRLAGEPMAYILGYKDFYGLRFKVNKDVLIPRPETEWIVERIKNAELGMQNGITRPVSILDMATGSGCIAITIAKQFSILYSQFSIHASDISPAALKVAKQNAKVHKTKIKFIQSDLFKNIDGKFDVIIANLPYVPIKIYKKFVVDTEIRFEPISALTDGTKSFQIYRRFFEQVGAHINQGGIILLEIDPSSRKFLIEYQKKYLPSASMKFYKDFNKLWRYAEVKIK